MDRDGSPGGRVSEDGRGESVNERADRNWDELMQELRVMQTGTQWLGKITVDGREALIPLVKEMIVEVNVRNCFIRVDLPDGLLEVYQ